MPDRALDSATAATTQAAQRLTRISLRVHSQIPRLVIPPGIPTQLELDFELAPIPNAKSWLKGVLNLRGNLVPIFDLAQWHGLPPEPSRGALIVSPGPRALGVLCVGIPDLLVVGEGLAVDAGDPLHPIAAHRYSADEGVVYELDLPAWVTRVSAQVAGRGQ